jgi:hypothetical protein
MVYRGIITKILLSLLVGAFGLYWQFGKNTNAVKKTNPFPRLIGKFAEQLNYRWKNGDLDQRYKENLFQCPEIPNGLVFSDQYLQCNSDYLNCYLQGSTGDKNQLVIEIDGKTYHSEAQKYENKKFVKIINKKLNNGELAPYYGLEVKLKIKEIKNSEMTFLLEDSCSMNFLPKRIYAAGTVKNDADLWDNFTQNYFLDKNYVSKRDIDEWLRLSGKNPKYVAAQWHEPALNLSVEEQKNFCLSRGKKLMLSHLLDAASFTPFEIFKPQEIPRRSIYPWGDRINKENNPKNNTISWMGINHIWGEELESTVNYFHPWLNLKVNSKHFAQAHVLQHLGRRVHWDGEDFFHLNFHFSSSINYRPPIKDIPLDAELGVAFRCYMERGDE